MLVLFQQGNKNKKEISIIYPDQNEQKKTEINRSKKREKYWYVGFVLWYHVKFREYVLVLISNGPYKVNKVINTNVNNTLIDLTPKLEYKAQ